MKSVSVNDLLVEALLKDEGIVILSEFFSCGEETKKQLAEDFLASNLTLDEYLKTNRSSDIIVMTAPNLE